MFSDDKYILLAINALDFLREETAADQEIKDFTHIAKQLINTMEKWEEVANYEECCDIILYALEEWEKQNFSNCSAAIRGILRSMMNELRFWNKTRFYDGGVN